MYRSIVLYFGYVESQRSSPLVFGLESGVTPKTRKEALLSLVNYLYTKFEIEESDHAKGAYYHLEKCCQEAAKPFQYKDYSKMPERCATCNEKLDYFKWKFDEEVWKQFLWNLQASDCDSYGEHLCVNAETIWSPWVFEFDTAPEQIVVIREQAEWMLTEVLYELHPELKASPDAPTFINRELANIMDESKVYTSAYHGYGANKADQPVRYETWIYPETAGIAKIALVNGKPTYVLYRNQDLILFDENNQVSKTFHGVQEPE